MKTPEILNLPKILDKRGNLSFFEYPNQLPFKIARTYWIYDVPGGEVRGSHAFKEQQEFIVALSGSFDLVFHKGKNGDCYNVGGFNEWQNIDLIKELCKQMDEKLGREAGTSEKLITFVKDRPGHDLRYAIDANKINQELGWKPTVTFEQGLSKTIDWFLENKQWLDNVTSGNYQKYYDTQYKD